ncbi:SUKH-3 domain-containing protein [Streptomyces olivaceus]|uniref:SUKH-3 domain-containing protein n=1 Tax=Streptomyces olivaceus TaxID=47716 RepID=UPI003643329E
MIRQWTTRTDRVLQRAGWHPGRRVPTATWEAILRERGAFVIHDAAQRFLSEFGGLVTYGLPADSITTASAVRFDPLMAEWQDERFAWAGREAGVSLYPVGAADEGASLLGMCEGGVLYLVRDRVQRLATDADQALDRLVEVQGSRAGLWASEPPSAGQAFRQRFEAVKIGPEAGSRWPAETDRVLRAGGWFPGRSLPTATWEGILRGIGTFEIHNAARDFLAEFGAVGVPHRDSGVSMPRRDFSLDPLLAVWDAEIIEDLAEQAGTDLYPVGMRDRRNTHLMMAADGAVYEGMDQVWLLAAAPDQAIERLARAIGPLAE